MASGLVYNPSWDPAPPSTPAPPQPSEGGGSFYTGGGYPEAFSPGSQGGHTQGPINTQFGFLPGSPGFQATQGAYEQSQAARQDALAKLLGGMPSQSAFGQMLLARMQNPRGLDPRALAEMRRMGADREAGSRGNALMRAEQSANAKGFGASQGLIDQQARIRTQSASNLNDFDAKLFIEDELRKLQSGESDGRLLASLLGIDAQLLQQYAQMQSTYAPPVIPGISVGPGGQAPNQNPHGTPPSAGAYWDPMVGGSGGWASR